MNHPQHKPDMAWLFSAFLAGALFFCAPAHAKTTPKELFDEAVRSAESGDLKKAEKGFKKVAGLSPDNYAAQFNLSLVYFHEDNFPASLKSLEPAAQLNPFDTRAGKLLASIQMRLGDYEAAQASLLSITQKDPRDINSHKKLGAVYLRAGNVNGALGELTLTRNLSPSDMNGALLLAAAHNANGDSLKAQERLQGFVNTLAHDTAKAFYASLLEKNGMSEEAKIFFQGVLPSSPEDLVPDLLSRVEQDIVREEAALIPYIKEYENSEITLRMADKLKKEEIPGAQAPSSKAQAKRPLNLKGTVTETWEVYQRTPKTSSPINGLNVTSNLKLEGKTENGTNLSGEWEGFFNRWDNHKLDYYKINATKRNDYEGDIGKFSPKRFPTLVSFPTVLEGIHLWKNITPRAFEATKAPVIEDDGSTPVNLGKMFEKNYVDTRTFKNFETIAVFGRTQERKNYGDEREKYEKTYESSGQFEQWTQSYRTFSKLNNIFEVGTSLSMTQDISSKTIVSSGTTPIESAAMGIDGGIDLLDGNLLIDGEIAYGNYDDDKLETGGKVARDLAWLFKSKYKVTETISLDYEQKAIGRNFEVEGASQTKDKTSHTIDFIYKPKENKIWHPMSHSIRFMPEIVSPDGGGTTKQRYTTVQSITDFKLPYDSKYTLDYKYYREIDKCNCTDYKTITLVNSLEYTVEAIQTTFKPSYSFERKDDFILSPTDEKTKEYAFDIENTSIKNLELSYSFEREHKKYNGATTKSYRQYINSFEAKYTFIPSRLDMTIKASQDYKNPSDTNKTEIEILAFELDYTTKDGDNTFNLEYEKKDNVYLPWSDSSAYYQQYVRCKYTRRF